MERPTQQGVDSRALLAVFIRKLPVLLLLAAAGAVLGSGLHLLIVLMESRNIVYVSETEYYIEFAPGRYEAKDYYNAYTWNDVMATDLILGRAMELLGDYDRNQVRNMITAEILSDVRYLTVTVRGEKAAQVEEIKSALETALGEFGDTMEEFDAIYKIEDLGITREKTQYFAWRAAFLGAVLFICADVFVTAFRFGIGSAFYTKSDITKALGLPVYGLTFCDKKGKDKADGLVQKQTQMLAKNLKLLGDQCNEVVLLDASDGRYAQAFMKNLEKRGNIDTSGMRLYHMEQELSNTAIVAVIPFGITYREKITDEIKFAELRGAQVEGAVLVEADRFWEKIYYGRM